ncbi:MAG TPA: IclR family transcriptional regulator [Conexibacter sp.]|nr:IclR family transcriptional regulator [Conexibacter sp.]
MTRQDALGPVARALHLLRAVAEADQPLSATELASAVGLPTSTAHRLLQLLREHAMVDLHPVDRRYRPGIEYYRLGALVVAKQPVAETARPLMTALVDEVNESCLLGLHLPESRKMMFAAQVESTHALRFAIPMQVPLELVWGCSGRVIVAYLGEHEIAATLQHADPSPVLGIAPPKRKAFEADLAAIRARGWDFTRGEKIPHSVGLASPIFTARGVIGSLSLTIPTVRFEEERRDALAALLTEQTSRLSSALGAAGSSAGASIDMPDCP